MLNKDEVIKAFMNIQLEENYNFFEEDLVTLANAFVKAAKPLIEQEERSKCIDIANMYDDFVGTKIMERRLRLCD
jgi:hypothetical protein